MLNRTQSNAFYTEVGHKGTVSDLRALACGDLFFLLSRVLGRRDVDNDWLYDRVREFEASPDGHLDLWAREHYKSTIITYAGTIREIINNPNITIGIFSHTRPIAKGFLRQIKREFEGNQLLQSLFPFVAKPQGKDVRSWSEDGGITVVRSSNPKEATLEAWGLVDGQPTSKHFDLLIYDDVVTRESVTTKDMIAKVTDAWALSLNLGAHGGRVRTIGTRYHINDTYKTMVERQAVRLRTHPATHDGTPEGEPVFLSRHELDEKLRRMGPYIFGAQMLQNPTAAGGTIIKGKWLKRWSILPRHFDRIIQSWDMAFKDTDDSDYVVGGTWGQVGADTYLLDQVRDKLDFVETVKAVVDAHTKWLGVSEVLIEDKANGPAVLNTLRHHVPGLVPVEPYGNKIARTHAVVPYFAAGNVYIPENDMYDWVPAYVAELEQFPIVANDDQVDQTTQALYHMYERRPMVIDPEVVRVAHEEMLGDRRVII